MTLGEVDYGLIGVVGGLVGFMSFFNGLMAASVARFYAFSVGQMQAAEDANRALDECRRWFNAAVAIHTVVPIVSLLIGYPIGEWAVRNYLTIPPERVDACVWVFRISCFSCLVSMMSVPYQAMYTAKQEIAELTIYDFMRTTFNFVFLCYMVTHPADWFVRYVGWTVFLSVAPTLVILVRSFYKYQECRFVFFYLLDMRRVRELIEYAGYRFLSSIAALSAYQGMIVLVNKMLGPSRNAAMTLSNNIQSHALSLMGALRVAMTPAIANATGAGDFKRVENLACRTSVYTSLSVAIFAIPLSIEIDEVLTLWLKQPPEGMATLTVLALVTAFFEEMTIGQCLSIVALKNIGKFQFFEALTFFMPFPIAWFIFNAGGGIAGAGIGFLALYLTDDIVKLYFVRKQCGHSLRRWAREVFFPVVFSAATATGVAFVPFVILPQSLFRVLTTALVSGAVLCFEIWFFVLQESERTKVIGQITRITGLMVRI